MLNGWKFHHKVGTGVPAAAAAAPMAFKGHCASPAQQMKPILQASQPHAADEQQRVKTGW
jgi:hypothetical protein